MVEEGHDLPRILFGRQHDCGGRQELVGRGPEEGEGLRHHTVRGLVEEDLVEDDLQRPGLRDPRERVEHGTADPCDQLPALLKALKEAGVEVKTP